MATRGSQLANSPELWTPQLRAYAVMAGATGLIATGQAKVAGEFLEVGLARLPKAVASESVFMVLRGYAARAAL